MSETAKRSFNEMRTGIAVNQAVNGSAAAHNTRQQNRNMQQSSSAGGSGAQQLTPQQRQQQLRAQQAILMGNTHGLSAQKRIYNFAETSKEILAKYEQHPPSLEFHIHENHYRFGNQDGIISKGSQLVKDFLEYVAREEIPHAIVEVLRDASIRFYEGCIILKVLDHRKSIQVTSVNPTTQKTETVSVPRSYRTLLKPTQLSLFYDLLYQTDSQLQRFSDQLGLSMESEILTITKRKLDLSVPVNLYKTQFPPTPEYPKVTAHGEVVFNHRNECEDPKSKAFNPFKELHEDLPHQNSEYERFMLIMNDKNNSGNIVDSTGESGQFSRLRFVEQWRIKKENMKQQSMSANLNSRQFSNGNGSSGLNMTPQQQQQIQQQRMMQLQQQRLQQQQQQRQQQHPQFNQQFNQQQFQQQQFNNQYQQQQMNQMNQINQNHTMQQFQDDEKKVKKPRKNQKNGEDKPEKKKRGAYKKKNVKPEN